MSGSAGKGSKNAWRRAQAKAKKEKAEASSSREVSEQPATTENGVAPPAEPETKTTSDHDAQPVTDAASSQALAVIQDDIDPTDSLYNQYKDVLMKFQEDADKSDGLAVQKPEVMWEEDEVPDEEDDQPKPLSKKKKKELNKLSVAELKALVRKPELVDWTDTSSPDPRLLVAIKGHRNVVPVPSHWSLKREYLSSKRGIEKPPFALPKFIQETGIAEMRDAVLEKQDQQTMKQKQRERVQGKLNKLDIDYQKLYEAFFRFQTKPELTRYGEVYYEGKEYETNLRHLRPGELSDELREALNMPPGAPPPWLINQQRFGPPPSYPGLKIPGLNAPPPPGASWGFHPGGYGKPPVDEYTNRPLFGGDIFGVSSAEDEEAPTGAPVEKTLWGELQEREEEEEEEEEDEDEDEEDGDEAMDEEDIGTGLETPSGMASAVPTEIGIESMGGDFELRKNARAAEPEDNGAPRSAYQVLPEQNIRAQGFFGGERAYDLRAAQQNLPVLGQENRGSKRKVGDIDVSVDVDALERDDRLSKDEIQRQFEAQRQAQAEGQWKGRVDQEDLSQMIAEESNKRLKQDKERNERRRGGGDSKSSRR